MRMRKKKHGAERLGACADLFVTEKSQIIHSEFDLEIGCGKGAFLAELAKRNPKRQYLAVERVADVLLLAAERIKTEGLQNVRLMVGDAATLADFLPESSVDTLYLNFSDPWPKKKQAKRRLTHRSFLEIYRKFLKPSGKICFKTDNRGLFEFSVEELSANGFCLTDVTFDLHNSPFAEENIKTEYEIKFSEMGYPIHRLVAHRIQG